MGQHYAIAFRCPKLEKIMKEQVTVIKIGGSTLEEEDSTLKTLVELHQQGYPLVLVHGGGPEIKQDLKQAGIETGKINRERVTDSKTLAVVINRLGIINHRIVSKLEYLVAKAHSFGPHSGLLEGEVVNPELGYVGRVSVVEVGLINQRLTLGEIPGISPVAASHNHPHSLLNINGDFAASAIAIALSANLALLTDVPGVLDTNKKLVPVLTISKLNTMYEQSEIGAGMIPKVDAAMQVSGEGMRAWILSAPNLTGLFRGNFLGTEVIR